MDHKVNSGAGCAESQHGRNPGNLALFVADKAEADCRRHLKSRCCVAGGEGVVALGKGAASLGIWKVLLVLLALMLVISGPAMILAWLKLRKRDLGPVLNANGWAINATSYVNTKFGAGLTKLAKLPKLTAVDPKARRRARWRRFLWILFLLAVLAVAACFLCCKFGWHSFTWCPFC